MLLAAVVALTGVAADEIDWVDGFEAALEAAQASNKPVMVVFSSGGGCGWCTIMATETLADERVVAAAASFLAVTVNGLERDDLATRYMVAGYPTVVFVSPDGVVLTEVSGYIPAEPFVGAMEDALEAWEALQLARALVAELGDAEGTPAQRLAIAREYATASSHRQAANWAAKALAAEDAEVRSEALLILGKALVDLDEPAEAVDPLSRFVASCPDHPGIWDAKLHLGYAYLMTDRAEEARPLLEDVVANAPEDSREHTVALRLLAWLDAQG